ncbi:uncharacterized protein SCHCODRAFT_02736642 [Schizophyllum commune H4-8]|uniref:uncharacterized protein n=1 Tax=Schizophyllum commune (strain H4-8 / FGSC 9210) TaxID=578458 RepID=UPI00215E10E1|nr:uncharacterized protein SCHCODRAFT_02736642 [Schizophyllum commune H4-8]KAI5890023.1 hypothetical protein SCHCODRAFT_02736642 [Schizophyllum commune H4-8]
MPLTELPEELLISIFLNLRALLMICIAVSGSANEPPSSYKDPRACDSMHCLICTDLTTTRNASRISTRRCRPLEALLLREDAYLNFKYRFEENAASDGYPSIYGLSSGRFFMGNEGRSIGVKSAKLPTEAGQRITWSEIFVGQSICDFGTAAEEHDLIAFVISSPTPDGLSCDIDVALYQLSGQPHLEAQRPRIHLLRVAEGWGPPRVSVEIVGDTLAVITYYALDSAANRLFLFSWRTGATLNPGGQPATNLGLCF